MTAKDVILQNCGLSEMLMEKYLDGLSDEDIKAVPVPGMQPIAWQIGHLIMTERDMLEGAKPGASPALPEDFEEAHKMDKAKSADYSGLVGKDQYVALMKAQREATRAALAGMSEAELDTPSPEKMRDFAPTLGVLFTMTGLHTIMHLGQFVATRRHFAKPIAF